MTTGGSLKFLRSLPASTTVRDARPNPTYPSQRDVFLFVDLGCSRSAGRDDFLGIENLRAGSVEYSQEARDPTNLMQQHARHPASEGIADAAAAISRPRIEATLGAPSAHREMPTVERPNRSEAPLRNPG